MSNQIKSSPRICAQSTQKLPTRNKKNRDLASEPTQNLVERKPLTGIDLVGPSDRAGRSKNQMTYLADRITPVQLFDAVRSSSSYAFLLESSDLDSRLARYSIIGIDPSEVLVFQSGELHVYSGGAQSTQPCADPLKELEIRTAKMAKQNEDDAKQQQQQQQQQQQTENQNPQKNASSPFDSAYVGYLAYGANRYFDAIVPQAQNPLAVPDGIFALYETVLTFDHHKRTLTVKSSKDIHPLADKLNRLIECSDRFSFTLETLPIDQSINPRGNGAAGVLQLEVKPEDCPAELQEVEHPRFAKFRSNLSKEQFVRMVLEAKSRIADGEVFQIVLSQRFEKKFTGDPFKIYRALQSINPSPYGYFLQFPDFVYLGSSPEKLLSAQDDDISLTALAGTRKLGRNRAEQALLERELKTDEKENAEHMMLVDLGRNDLGRVASPGSVSCGEIAKITNYGRVMHLSTDISAHLDEGKSCFDAVRSCFPAGTVSGAPKIRAMELLAKLEPEQRGIYSGLVGYFDLNGNAETAIAIRSALIKEGKIHINAGAGIVQDSIPSAEYEETCNKALSVVDAIELAEEIE